MNQCDCCGLVSYSIGHSFRENGPEPNQSLPVHLQNFSLPLCSNIVIFYLEPPFWLVGQLLDDAKHTDFADQEGVRPPAILVLGVDRQPGKGVILIALGLRVEQQPEAWTPGYSGARSLHN